MKLFKLNPPAVQAFGPEIVFIDRDIPNLDQFLLGIRLDVEVVVLSRREPAPVQIARHLERRRHLTTVHLVAHGEPGAVHFSGGALTAANLTDHAEAWAAIGRALGPTGTLALWSCETASGPTGQTLIAALSAHSGTRVAAARGLIGAPRKGGQWELDCASEGRAPTPPLTRAGQTRYAGVLSIATGTAGDDILAGTDAADLLYGIGGNDVLSGGAGDDVLVGGAGADTLDGGFGIDFADYSGSASAVYVTITADGTRNFGGDAQGDRLINIENLNGSAFDDVLIGDDGLNVLHGNDGDDYLFGGDGADSLSGGAGNDTASYRLATGPVAVSLDTGTGTAGEAAGDTLVNIENLSGSNFADTLTGNAQANRLSGYDGNDVFLASGGSDQIDGGDGVDTLDYSHLAGGISIRLSTGTDNAAILIVKPDGTDSVTGIEKVIGTDSFDSMQGDSQDNQLYGGGGDDFLIGDAGADRLDGGSGYDSVTYFASKQGVTVNLSTGVNHFGDAEGDALLSIEHLKGSSYDDDLTGTNADEAFESDAGNDTIHGGGGNDFIVDAKGNNRLYGGDGDDVVTSADGMDLLDGGAGIDTAFLIAYGGLGVVANLTTGTSSSSAMDHDTLVNIENLTVYPLSGNPLYTAGGVHDQLTGDQNANKLDGAAGGDRLDGAGGVDTADYSRSDAAVTVSLTAGAANHGGYAEGDVLLNIENLLGSAFADSLTGDAANNSLDGGTGTDTASYAGATAAVTVSLATQGAAQNTVGAGIDTLSNFENLTGSAFNDRLSGNAGNNVLNGRGGADTLTGGAGNDTYVVDNTGDQAVETAGGGTDTVQSAVTYTLGTEVENLLLTGANAINGTGNALADGLTGNAAANVLNGGIGNDVLAGKAGSDRLTGGAGNDAFVFDTALNNLAPAANIDHVLDFSAGQDRLRLDDAVFTKFAGATAVSADQFAAAANPVAATVNQVLLYDTGTGALYYDADGSGSGVSLLVAILDNHASITAGDLSII